MNFDPPMNAGDNPQTSGQLQLANNELGTGGGHLRLKRRSAGTHGGRRFNAGDNKGRDYRHDLKLEARMWLDLVCARIIPSKNTTHVPIETAILVACIMDCRHINVEEIIAEQFKRKARQKATSMPYPVLISLLCLHANYPQFRPLDQIERVEGVNSLATKIDKDVPSSKRL
ncbi:hypothetical protein HAX54_019335 [Datura stramonium]|uniref:Putative plant transposon protein domain-containing protein n=1 Tax=Datura stramonium TaxID=4076 RepID=A0ABS8UQL0_DATST|nr:hypothetical protein [Datura stramonium]